MIFHDLLALLNVITHLVLSLYAISSQSDTPKSRKLPKTYFFAFWIIQKCNLVTFEQTFMAWLHCQMFEIVNSHHNMQYQVHPTDLSLENDQNPPFWHFGSFKNAFWGFLNDPSWPGSVAECWKTYSSIKISNIKWFQQT